VRLDATAVGETDDACRAARLHGVHLSGADHLGAELERLAAGALRQLSAGDAVGEAEVVLDARALAGLPTGRCAFDQYGAQALGRGIDGSTQPGRPSANDDDVVELGSGIRSKPDMGGDVRVAGCAEHLPFGGDDHWDASLVRHLSGGQQPLTLGLRGGIPAVRHPVAGQEIPHLERTCGPAVPDHLRLGDRPVRRSGPLLQQLGDDRVQLLLRRVPGFEQVVVDVHQVDRLDGCIGVGVGGEQDPPGRGKDVHGLLKELDAIHLRHPVVRHDHRDLLAAELELTQRFECLRPALATDDPVLRAVFTTQVAGDGP
jgi:hypothetical protein